MPRTLTAGVLQAIVAQEYGYDLLVESESVGLRQSWFYEPDSTWEHRLLHVEDVENGVPSGGGVGFISQLAITLAEDGTGQSVLEETEASLFGAEITLKLLFTGEAYADAIPLFTGHIMSWEVWDGEAQIVATDDRLARSGLLPATVVTEATHPNAPEQSIGQAVPIVYGSGNTLAPIPLLLVDTVTSIYQVSHHDNGQMLAVFGAWPLGTDRLKTIEATAEQAVVVGTNRLQLLQRLTETKLGVNTALPTIFDTQGNVDNETNLTDGDPATLCQITTTAGTGIGRILLDYVHPDPVGVNTIDIALLQHRRVPASSVTVHGSFRLDTIRQDGTTGIQGLFSSLERRVASTPQDEHFRIVGVSLEAGHILRMTVSAINETGTVGTIDDAYEVGQVDVQASYLVSGPFEAIYLPDVAVTSGSVFEEGVFEDGVFAETSEAPFRGRTDDELGSITGSPNAILENPVDVIHSIVRHECGFTVDPTTIAAAREARSTWRMAGGLGAGWFRGRTTTMDVLQSLCLQAGVYCYPQGNGTFVIKAVSPLDAATFVIGPAGSANDYLLYTPMDPARPGTTWRRTLRYRSGRSDQIRNNFEIRYAFHSARQRFSKMAYASHLGTNDTQGRVSPETITALSISQSRYGTREPYQLDADFLYNNNTAFRLLNLLVPYWASPRQEVEFESTMAPLGLLLGETVQMDTTGMPASMRGQVFEIDRIRYDFTNGRIFLHGTQRSLLTMDYFRIRDQAGTIWYLWIDAAGAQLVRSLTPPAPPGTILTDITPPTIPYWLNIADATATPRYVLPTPLGQVQVQSTVPPVGSGYTGSPIWLEQRGGRYWITTNTFLQYTVEQAP